MPFVEMSCTGKSTRTHTSTKTVNGKTTTTVTVEETLKYSDGREEKRTREMTVEGPPPTKEQIVSDGLYKKRSFRIQVSLLQL